MRDERTRSPWSSHYTLLSSLSYLDTIYEGPKTVTVITSLITDHQTNTIHKKFEILKELPKCNPETQVKKVEKGTEFLNAGLVATNLNLQKKKKKKGSICEAQ